MDKKVLKWYETPAMEVVNVEVEGQILAGSAENAPTEDPSEEIDL
jgi:hypothetical protein